MTTSITSSRVRSRATVKERSVYTIVSCLPIEADGRPRYRIKSKSENVERVVTEEQISRLGWFLKVVSLEYPPA